MTILPRTLIALISIIVSGCGQPPLPSITPIGDVVVGSVITCDPTAMRRHCDAWLADARQTVSEEAAMQTAPIEGWTFHVGHWNPIASHTTRVIAVVVFRLSDGSIVNVPIACSVHPPGDARCDVDDVALPAS